MFYRRAARPSYARFVFPSAPSLLTLYPLRALESARRKLAGVEAQLRTGAVSSSQHENGDATDTAKNVQDLGRSSAVSEATDGVPSAD
jgi:hypothetical protein